MEQKETEKRKRGRYGEFKSKSAYHGEREVEQTFEKRGVKLMIKENVTRITKSM